MEKLQIVVVGAGVTGLTTALRLSKYPNYRVKLIAKHMPGDYDAEYASPWAGASFWPVGSPGSQKAEWEKNTWYEFERLARSHPEAGIHFLDSYSYIKESHIASTSIDIVKGSSQEGDPWYSQLLPKYRHLENSELRGHDRGASFTSVCLNTALYLPWLLSRCLAAGVEVQRRNIKHISEAFTLDPAHNIMDAKGSQTADLVVNCTGLSARTLGGVEDKSMYPIRGQTVLVRNETPHSMLETRGVDGFDDELVYIMQRAAGGGTLIGGTYMINNDNPQVDQEQAERIMRRAVEILPELVGKTSAGPDDVAKLDVIRHNVGFRPAREGGTRVEAEKIEVNGVQKRIVHSYGHAGFGYQTSVGCAMDVEKLVAETLAR